MKSGVYIITCLINNKHYIGYSKNIKYRLSAHKLCLRNGTHDNFILQSAFNIYGEHNFTFDPLEYYPEEIMASMENWWCNMLNTHNRKFGYNIKPTGDMVHLISNSTKLKMSENNKGAGNGFYGKKHSEEVKMAISIANSGRIAYNKGIAMPEVQKEKLRKRIVSVDTKQRMSEAAKRKVFSKEHRLNMAKARLGRTFKIAK